MNQYQEAIKAIKSNYPPSNYSMLREALDLSIKLLEKATPKKVTKPIPLNQDVRIGHATFKKGTSVLSFCPSCGKWLNHAYHKYYCGHCGQSLDWSDIYV